MTPLQMLKRLEWSGRDQGPGSGPMFSGGDGVLISACPICRGIKPDDPHRHEFAPMAWGHRGSCELKKILDG